jgi:hypothetical protein
MGISQQDRPRRRKLIARLLIFRIIVDYREKRQNNDRLRAAVAQP